MIQTPRLDPAARITEAARTIEQTAIPWASTTIRAIPKGARITITSICRWCAHHDDDDLIESTRATINRLDSRDPDIQQTRAEEQRHYRDMIRDHRSTQITRTALALTTPVFICTQWDTIIGRFPMPAQATAIALAFIALGIAGRKETDTNPKPPTGPAALTETNLRRALANIRVHVLSKALNADSDAVSILEDKTRVDGGWQIDLMLPEGVTYHDLVRNRHHLAANLGQLTECVQVSGIARQPDRSVRILVTDSAVSDRPRVQWPLLREGAASVWEPVTIGVDDFNQPVQITLAESCILVGGSRGFGKSFTVRLLTACAALDPTCDILVFEGLGSGEFNAMTPRISIHSGSTDDNIEQFLVALRAAVHRMDNTIRSIGRLDANQAPESKLTRNLVSPDLGTPTLLVMDEPQIAFSHPEHGPEIRGLVGRWVKEGRKAGTAFIASSQEPNADSFPSDLRRMCNTRIAHGTSEYRTNDMILGSGSHSEGLTTTGFDERHDRGLVILKGLGHSGVRVRIAYLNAAEAGDVAARSMSARLAAGYGHNPRNRPDTTEDTFTGHVRDVWPTGQSGPVRAVSYTYLLQLLANKHPDIYQTIGDVSNRAQLHDLEETSNALHLDPNGRSRYSRKGITWASLPPTPTSVLA